MESVNEKGILYIVATPIGNLEDITLRAINVLKDVDVIAAEDTRHTLKLLNHFEISKPLISYHRHNEDVKSDILIEKLQNGQSLALVSDAGTPGICDPGEGIIKKCIDFGITIVPIPGACAMINSLVCSGISTKEFTFLGFLPLNKKLRRCKLEEIEKSNKTIIVYEAPHKIGATLRDLKQVLDCDRKVVLAREITKVYEEFIRGNIDDLINRADDLKGEIVLIIEGCNRECEENELNGLTLQEHYKFYECQGFVKKDIIKMVAKDRNLSKNDVYKEFF